MPFTHDDKFDVLFSTILSLETVQECYDFFEDLCTINELTDMRDRLEVAILLPRFPGLTDVSNMETAVTGTHS
jgi:TrpR-related protein YerC/YecD